MLSYVVCWTDARSEISMDGQAFIHEVKWDTEMHTPIARKLVNEANGKKPFPEVHAPKEVNILHN